MPKTVAQTIWQSWRIHPDWTFEDHLSYLNNDAFMDVTRDDAWTAWIRLQAEGYITPQHDRTCVCSVYDRCATVRSVDAMRAPTHNAAIRARNRAYND
jgi:hypothetical protein